MKAFRAAILRFAADGSAVYEQDGLLVTGPAANGQAVVRAVGSYEAVAASHPGVPVEHLPGRIIAPGFIDLHIHFPQTDVIGSPAEGLLPWLEDYTFPHESRFADETHAAERAIFFVDELLRHGVTTALAFGTSHPESVDALLAEAQRRGMRMIAGKVLQDRHCPDGVRDETAQSLAKPCLGSRAEPRRVETGQPPQGRPRCLGGPRSTAGRSCPVERVEHQGVDQPCATRRPVGGQLAGRDQSLHLALGDPQTLRSDVRRDRHDIYSRLGDLICPAVGGSYRPGLGRVVRRHLIAQPTLPDACRNTGR